MKHSENKSSDEKTLPAFIAYHVPEREKAPWTRIGAAWVHKDGKGFTLQLDLVPASGGRIVLRTFEEKQEEEERAWALSFLSGAGPGLSGPTTFAGRFAQCDIKPVLFGDAPDFSDGLFFARSFAGFKNGFGLVDHRSKFIVGLRFKIPGKSCLWRKFIHDFSSFLKRNAVIKIIALPAI